jgi:prolyl-tRNA synthetase
MRWKDGRRSTNVEDIRGSGGPRRLGGGPKMGGGALLVLLVIGLLSGKNPLELLAMLTGSGGSDTSHQTQSRPPSQPDPAANEDGFHLRNVSMERDIKVTEWHDLRTVTAGEPCAKCGKALKIRRAIEVGHVFKLGTKYSEKLGANFLDEAGGRKPLVMGCYGIGITRTLQAVIEQCNDKDGIIWPLSVAPYQVCITPLSVTPESPAMKLAETIYSELTAQGVDVILDDRDDRPGVKFKDADLVGFPIRVSIGEKSLAKGEVEIKPRGGAVLTVRTDEAVASVMSHLKS